ncbi:MAG: Aconitate hydratase [Candidatus Hinthialibacteria bacterium OLB16]|nr:MAG: Aconitate hydratase [Candidatus Hinthialibacteria bacterium OLB16]
MDSFGSHGVLKLNGHEYRIARLQALEKQGYNLDRLPFSLKILLENLLRCEDGHTVTTTEIEALAKWDPKAEPDREIAFMPGRVLLQDFTGVPAVVDLAAMRDAMLQLGGDPKKINPLLPAELVIDHSVQVDAFGNSLALDLNAGLEFSRNRERYSFLRWGQNAFRNFRVVPPDTGIVHQVNLEYLARVVMVGENHADAPWAYPDSLVGTDSHTTMINGLGVLGWGVGGIEAEAAMLGQPLSMLIPQVIGFCLKGRLPEGTTATDLVLHVTQILRKKGVVGKFVEFFGPGLAELRLADRATIGNMAPEYGATCGIFPVDEVTLSYLRFSGRSEEQVRLVETYMKEQGLFRTASSPIADYSDIVELDLSGVEPSLAGPKRPQDRVNLPGVRTSFLAHHASLRQTAGGDGSSPAAALNEKAVTLDGEHAVIRDGAVAIAAITSCTNTSNPSVLIAAGLLAEKAVEKGLSRKPWVKTSLAPGSLVVTEYLKEAGLLEPLEKLGFYLVGYGCTTCIGNSGPLPEPVAQAIDEKDLVVASVLSGNRNFEGRVHAQVRANYLASPPLVVAYALAGKVDIDLSSEPLGLGYGGKPVYLKDIWPSQREIEEKIQKCIHSAMFRTTYADVFKGDERWRSLAVPEGDTFSWDPKSTYVKRPPFFENLSKDPQPVCDIEKARALAVLGDSITTDHISPAGSIKPTSPAGKYLQSLGVAPADFNSLGSRRGNHEVMMRGTFANIRLRNQMVPGVEGGFALHLPDQAQMSIYDAAMKYREEGVPLVILAGKEYGAGSSRDWAAKGPCLLGIRAAIAESFERIHRSNLVGMGVVPLQFESGQTVASLGLTGHELFDILGLAEAIESNFANGRQLKVRATRPDNSVIEFSVTARIDTPKEIQYYRHGGILPYVLRKLLEP